MDQVSNVQEDRVTFDWLPVYADTDHRWPSEPAEPAKKTTHSSDLASRLGAGIPRRSSGLHWWARLSQPVKALNTSWDQTSHRYPEMTRKLYPRNLITTLGSTASGLQATVDRRFL